MPQASELLCVYSHSYVDNTATSTSYSSLVVYPLL